MKRWIYLALIVIALVAVLGGLKAFGIYQMIQGFKAQGEPKFTVSTQKVSDQEWATTLSAVGSLRAVRGATLSTEVGGLVAQASYRSGSAIKAGEVVLKLIDDADAASVRALRAARDLAKTNAERSGKQFEAEAISQAQLDTDKAQLAQAEAQLAQAEAQLAKKTIRAPFDGQLGISTINRGQYLNAGDPIVTLTQLDPIYVDFTLPQQEIAVLKSGGAVQISTDAYPGERFEGEISALDPVIDPSTRNVQVQATIRNPQKRLLPGMFANVTLTAGAAKHYLTLPQTAVSFNPYGETVYVVVPRGQQEQVPDNKPVALRDSEAIDSANAKLNAGDGKKAAAAEAPPADPNALVARQVFVKVGPTRGDQIAIVEGLKAGQEVVTSGQLKLKNGSVVVINNALQMPNESAPKPENE